MWEVIPEDERAHNPKSTRCVIAKSARGIRNSPLVGLYQSEEQRAAISDTIRGDKKVRTAKRRGEERKGEKKREDKGRREKGIGKERRGEKRRDG